MKHASEVMADKYRISSRCVYQIWRGVDPPMDTREMKLRSAKVVDTLNPTSNDSKTKRKSKSNTLKTVSISNPGENMDRVLETKKETISNIPGEDVIKVFKRVHKGAEKTKMEGDILASRLIRASDSNTR